VEVDDEVVGEVGLADVDTAPRTAEIGWWIAAHHRGGGLAARSARLLAAWAVEELCVDAVIARCRPDNPGSSAVARAAGFEHQGSDGGVEVWRFP
jgi:ribosomal-protein-alanine N-acetyltransferase